jgi:lysophospholipase L1-like esterase
VNRSDNARQIRRLLSVAVLCMLALCAGCGARPSIDGLTGSSVVVAFGDSLTSGTGADKAQSYPSVLSGLIGCRVVNAGVPGEDTTAGLRRLPGILKKEPPDLVILCHGGNDILSGESQDTTRANLSAMISMVKDAGADLILIGVPQPGLRLRAAPFYAEIAKQYTVPFDPDTIAAILSTPSLRSDRVHPNAAGYKRLAESIAALIVESEARRSL